MNATEALTAAVLADPRWRPAVRRAMRRAWRETPRGRRSWAEIRSRAVRHLRCLLFRAVQRFAVVAGRNLGGPYGAALAALLELSPVAGRGVDLHEVACHLVDGLGEPMALLERSVLRRPAAQDDAPIL